MTTMMTAADERQMANAVRALAMDAVQAANSGHPGMPMGMADVAAVLFNRFVKLDPADPKWPDRDRFVLSAGHGSMLLYAMHHLLGYKDMPMDRVAVVPPVGRTDRGASGIWSCRGDRGHHRALGSGHCHRRSAWRLPNAWRRRAFRVWSIIAPG